ncbi:DUF5947 family protein [Saccharomonospora sp.]|uniref:DUF5947 family protein n=1 Tax=Saccharomonospora sp. TaxID=33913 RepID=UPI0026175714|nr:DUF5947 family protein [Saccharomonospora sp.]
MKGKDPHNSHFITSRICGTCGDNHGDLHGYRTIADIVRAFNPFEGEVYKRALEISRITRQMCCACQACALLFERDTTDTGRYRTVPRLRKRLTEPPVDDVMWAALEVPVRLALFVHHIAGCEHGFETVTAYYPSPLGVVGTDVDAEAWARVEHPPPEPEVTALLVHRDAGEHWLVGIDECYRLTARVRHAWTGMTGGDEVWREIDRFFAELRDGVGPT